MYVARFTHDPQDDIERGWSGWMGSDFSSVADAAEFFGIDIDEQTDDALLDILLEKENTDLRFDDRLKVWRTVHHEGLSCFALEATTIEDAMSEAKSANLMWEGFGDKTIGNVKVIGAVEGVDDLFIFECDDATGEN